ncbi:hypothetical protein RMN57_11675 [Kitasatospora sp. CM 4170]|uniref:Uncharacterized protein n=1 Tax=Kitasatospora aburaviensis TaxID=67265 RepID=A0ABW1EPR1_9ACTN|nr:hypothetical protein [Kitasatospora sp. CM 4170]WNM45326.1 hypothetical protein RMN57_11675 [Kitasatospora sp. CM 4170]
MSSGSFRIDLVEVEAAARRIQALVRELEPHAARVEAAVRQVSPASYGTDQVGAALLGGAQAAGGPWTGGLIGHQGRALQGMRRYLWNSGRMAENLLLMCRHYREADGSHAAALQAVIGGSGEPPRPAGFPAGSTAGTAAAGNADF